MSKTILGWNNSVITCKKKIKDVYVLNARKLLDKEDKREMGR